MCQAQTERERKSNVTGYFPPEVKKQLRLLAAERNATIQNLFAEASNDLFAKNGKPELAPRSESDRLKNEALECPGPG